jgi:hypothetical protein
VDVVGAGAITGRADDAAATGAVDDRSTTEDATAGLFADDVAAIVIPGLVPPVEAHAALLNRTVAVTAVRNPARPPSLGTGMRIRSQHPLVETYRASEIGAGLAERHTSGTRARRMPLVFRNRGQTVVRAGDLVTPMA